MPATEREACIAEATADLANRAADFDALDLLHDLTYHANVLLRVQSAGTTVVDDRGQVHYATASDERCRGLEEVQVELGEGPCLDIARTNAVLPPIGFCAGSPGEEHWPRFAPHAREAGVVAIAAVPLRTSDTTVGALNLVNTGKPVIPVTDLRIAQAFTEAAMGCFAHYHRVNGLKQVVSQLEGALHSRVAIEQAKGVLSERFHIPLDEAFARLRGYARSRSLKLRALANDVAHGRGPSELHLQR
ncbi:ANTAR domain-containing protein [Amycolatopsis thailandensis]|uniref:ANTAR domain-containing protein n=1 Tax=Amycolatopsis thailandensis TaxID=589330 RepID=UPI003665574C